MLEFRIMTFWPLRLYKTVLIHACTQMWALYRLWRHTYELGIAWPAEKPSSRSILAKYSEDYPVTWLWTGAGVSMLQVSLYYNIDDFDY